MTLRLDARPARPARPARSARNRVAVLPGKSTPRIIDLTSDSATSAPSAPSEMRPAASSERTFTVLRTFALAVVVLWHWVFATVRWDAKGPHSGNPLHQLPGGFLLTWCLQVMPVFFFVGGMVSLGSLDRHVSRGGSSRSWVTKRLTRLVMPVVPLVGIVAAAKLFASTWLFGVIMLAVSPLWFLGVYVPLTLLTPALRTLHRRFPVHSVGLSFGSVLAMQYARFGLGITGVATTLLSFIFVWGTVYQLGFFLHELIANKRASAVAAALGVAGLAAGPLFGYSLSMVTTVNDARSNMGPPTSQIVFLALFQAGMIGLLFSRLTALANRVRVASIAKWIDRRQMTIYAIHLPIWVALMTALRFTPVAIADAPTLGWWLTRLFWLVTPGTVLYAVVRGGKPAAEQSHA